MKRFAIILVCLMAALSSPAAHEGKSKLSFENTVYDFGCVTADIPVSCTFTAKNPTQEPITILSVISHCSCTSAEWQKTPVGSGEQSTVTVTYTNDDGEYPFDKTLYVYVSDSRKPVVLHIRGISVKKEKK